MKLLIPYTEIPTEPPNWLIKDQLTQNSLAAIFGAAGEGKSFIALDIAYSIATGEPFHGYKVQKGNVIFVAGEGHGGLKKRVRALEIVRGNNVENNFLISTQPIPLGNLEWLKKLRKAIDESFTPSLIIVDTLNRNFGPEDENSTSDMSRFVAALDHLRVRYRCTVLVIHHTGHSQKDRGRGNSSFKAALDHEFKVHKDSTSDVIKFSATKTKDFIPPTPMAFKLVTTETDIRDENDSTISSAVLQSVDYTEPVNQPIRSPGKNQKLMLEMLKELTIEHEANVIASGRDPSEAAVTIIRWRDACMENGVERNRFHEAKDSLHDSGFIELDGRYVRIRS